MNKKLGVKRLSALLMLIVMTLSIGITAYAATKVDELQSTLSSIAGTNNSDLIEEAEDLLNQYGNDTTADVQTVSFNGGTWYFEANGTKAVSMNTTLKSSLSGYNSSQAAITGVDEVRTDIQEITRVFNIKADVTGANAALAGFKPMIELICGLLFWIVITFLGVFTAFDVCYLVFPVAKGKMDSAGQSGGRITSSESKATGESKFRFVTDDALLAYEESAKNGQNGLILYLKKRVWTYVACSIVVYMLGSGNMALIIEAVLKLCSGFFNMFQGFATS